MRRRAIGTTQRGIGPAYEDKVGRRAIRLMDLAEPDTLPHKIERLLAHHNALRRGLDLAGGRRQGDPDGTDARWRRSCCPMPRRVWRLLDDERRAGKRMLFEGAQGALLDVDHGTYPLRHLVQRRWPARPRPASGLGPGAIDYVLGIAQGLYDPRRRGPVPDRAARRDRRARSASAGREFGAITGRKRRCGWFDAVLVRQTVSTSGIDGIALTKLDILDGFEAIKVCVGYKLDGKEIDHFPAERGRPGPGRADLRDHRGLDAIDRRRTVLGRPAGPGHQICAPHRGIDGVPGRHAFDQPRTRRYYPGAQSV